MVELKRNSRSKGELYTAVLKTDNRNSKRHQSDNFNTEFARRDEQNDCKMDINFNYATPRYNKKLPISFIAAKDWSLYIHFANKSRISTKKKHKNRVYRLLNSFINLYQEYSYVCDNILPFHTDHSDDKFIINNINNEKFNNQNVYNQGQGGDTSKRLYPSRYSEFINHYSCTNKKKHSEAKLNSYENSMIKRWFIGKLHHLKSKSSMSTQLYDKIYRYQHETIEIYSNDKMQNVVSHKISFTGFDSLGHPKIKWVPVPIALELLIPKIQSKIQRIMKSCDFLQDPLEVVAELRYFNYNVDMCTVHFQKSKKFRDIVEEFLPEKCQFREIESQPEFWEKFKKYLDKVEGGSQHLNINDRGAGRKSHTNSLPKIHEHPSKNDISKKIECDKDKVQINSLIHSKLIKVICSIEKLKLLKSEIHQLVIKSKTKYSKQIADHTAKIVRVVELFKDFLMTDEQRGRVIHLLKQNDELKLKLREEEKKRKTIYNLMQDQLGNVRVYCRCRNFEKNQSVFDIKAHDTIVMQTGFCEEYKFDKVFDPLQSQAKIYEEFQPLIMSFIDGFNVCFITYGGEASGKTYTLLGSILPSQTSKDSEKYDGIMKRALKEVLAEQSSRKRDWEYTLSANVVEIYNDTFIDLLTGDIGIHLPIERGLEKVQDSLKTVSVHSDADIEALIKVCKLKRKVGKTALNPQSSRSHLITMIRLKGRSKIHGETISSFLAMCDLAGSEDILKAETHNDVILSKEAGYINKSLTAFNRVFTSLRNQDPNTVSYRDTKLTYLLKPFLTNQGKCVLIVTVRTDKLSISSTQSTLRFGRESRGVALGKVKRQTNLDKIIL